ncbi:MAG: sugar phosphate nucleotidyltransferase [Gemmatimonadota bacterium]
MITNPKGISGFTAVIMAGGEGTRLAPYTHILPKPLLPVGGRSILDLVITGLVEAGCRRVILCTGYLDHLIRIYVGTGERWGVEVEYFHEDRPLGTVGAVALLSDLPEDGFLVMNGDILTDLRFQDLLADHREWDADLTIAAYRRTVQESLGVIEADSEMKITGYREKPETEYLVSTGIYVFGPGAVSAMSPGERLDLPDLVHRLIYQGKHLRARLHTGTWLDLGRPDDLLRANEEFGDATTPPHV